MMVVDSSVWINLFRNHSTPAVEKLTPHLAYQMDKILVPDLVFLEVTRGARSLREFNLLDEELSRLPSINIAGIEACRSAARKYTQLRNSGYTVAKTVDLLIASWCIDEGVPLLHDDKDFEPFKKLGLKMA